LETKHGLEEWESVLQKADDTAVGTIAFPAQAVVNPIQPDISANLKFTDGNLGWRQ
jgi:hypothetical protein